MPAISKPVRQFAAVSLLIAAVLALYGLLIDPMWRHFSGVRERIAEERILLGRLSAAAGRQIEASQIERMADSVPVSRLVLKGDTEAIQLASLQSIVGEAAAKRGIRIASARALPAIEVDGQRLLGVRFDVRSEIGALQSLLHGIEASEPLLIVHGLQIRGAGSNAAAADQPALLDASVSIFGAQPPGKG